MSSLSSAGKRAIYHIVEEGIIIDGYLKGAGMDPFDSLFKMLGSNFIVKGTPEDRIFSFLPWLLLAAVVVLVFIFGRLLSWIAMAIAFLSGLYFAS